MKFKDVKINCKPISNIESIRQKKQSTCSVSTAASLNKKINYNNELDNLSIYNKKINRNTSVINVCRNPDISKMRIRSNSLNLKLIAKSNNYNEKLSKNVVDNEMTQHKEEMNIMIKDMFPMIKFKFYPTNKSLITTKIF